MNENEILVDKIFQFMSQVKTKQGQAEFIRKHAKLYIDRIKLDTMNLTKLCPDFKIRVKAKITYEEI